VQPAVIQLATASWHLAHAKHCVCREIPAGVSKTIHKLVFRTPLSLVA